MTADELAHVHSMAFTIPQPWPASDFAKFLDDPSCFIVAYAVGGVTLTFGLFRVVANEAELLTLATDPSAQRKGMARNVLRDGLAQAKARGAEYCFLEVAANNEAAILLYHSEGFMQVGLRKSYYRMAAQSPVDALVLRAFLG